MFDSQKLIELRKEKGMTVTELADEVGCNHSFITHIEKGYKQPGILLLGRIADYFSVSMDDLRKQD